VHLLSHLLNFLLFSYFCCIKKECREILITPVDRNHFGIEKQLIKMNYQKELSLEIKHAATAMSLLLPWQNCSNWLSIWQPGGLDGFYVMHG
jgi:hypothetical protein